MPHPRFHVGDRVIYRKTKQSVKPGPRAHDVKPSPKGEDYSYVVDKFWVVAEICDDGSLVLKTRRGKEHRVQANDPALRKAGWWQRWWNRARFEDVETRDSHPQQ